MKKYLLLILFIFEAIISFSQGLNNLWLLGYNTNTDSYTTAAKAVIDFSTGIPNILPDNRKMKFQETQGNISNSSGNLLMSSNGVWIADATTDTMLNGSDLNPNPCTSDYSQLGLMLTNANVFLPYPGDTTKFILFHTTCDYNTNLSASRLFYSVIDITQNGGLGRVIFKNQIALQDTINWGIGVCRHANGRDWWIIVLKDNSDLIYKILLTPTGIQSISSQHMGTPNNFYGNVCQPTFSPDGKKFSYTSGHGPPPYYLDVRLFNFDRCTGIFSNYINMPIYDTHPGFACAFSPNSKYLYAASTYHIYQINTDTTNIAASLDTVATNDGFFSPVSPFQTNFELMYLAMDGKIYLSTANGTNAIHYINYPDSDGTSCDVHQHGIILPCYNVGTVPNHPNYFLGCDTTGGCTCLATGIDENSQHDFHFSVYPNPVTDQEIKISYLLPQNKKGVFEMYDITGRKIFSSALPQWSTMQNVLLPALPTGVYAIRILSDGFSESKKMIINN